MKTFIAAALLSVAVCLIQAFPADKMEIPKDKEHASCAGGNLTISEDLKTKLDTCMKKTKPTEDGKEKYDIAKSCAVICSGQAIGVLDAAGKSVKDKLATTLKEIFPAANVKDITTGLTACVEKHEKSLVLKEGDCSSYNEIVECGTKAIMKVCHPGE